MNIELYKSYRELTDNVMEMLLNKNEVHIFLHYQALTKICGDNLKMQYGKVLQPELDNLLHKITTRAPKKYATKIRLHYYAI